MAIPAIPSATPESETSKEMVIGMSAPPTRMVKATPKKPLMRIPRSTLITRGTEGTNMTNMASMVRIRERVVIP